MKTVEKDRFIISVRVGPKGQITVPVEARRMFGIEEGDTLMLMGDASRGMALFKADKFYQQMGGVIPFDGDKDN
ncbi:MAG: AbrB/MazE/SpoVT family DNA-binding domain-containing protein [Clostridia bacterium]|nr:AbrB/MazE/SpoVT family DNA-binding domain-containing protein [Clostridia bacterium]